MLGFLSMEATEIKTEEQIEGKEKSTVYELGFLIIPAVVEGKVPQIVSSLKTLIEGNGGSFISEGQPALKPINYEMFKMVDNKKQKFSQAYFGWIKFELDSSKIAEIKTQTEKIPEILRFLLIKTVKENTMYSSKVITKREKPGKKAGPAALKSSNEEIDKSIENLVTNKTI